MKKFFTGNRQTNTLNEVVGSLAHFTEFTAKTPCGNKELSTFNKSTIMESTKTMTNSSKNLPTPSKNIEESQRKYTPTGLLGGLSKPRTVFKLKKLKKKLPVNNEELNNDLLFLNPSYISLKKFHPNQNCFMTPRKKFDFRKEEAFVVFKNRKKLNLKALEQNFNNSRVALYYIVE